jgi:hypothetical protein
MSVVYSIIIRPAPRGISREQLTSIYLRPCGPVKGLRFGVGKLNDFVYCDFQTPTGATEAVRKLNGESFDGSVRCAVSLTPATAALIQKTAQAEPPKMKRLRLDALAEASEGHVDGSDVQSLGRYKMVSRCLIYSVK